MRNKLFPILIVLFWTNLIIGQPLKNIKNFGENPGMLKMYMHVPKNFDQTKKPPLVLILHGCTQSAKSIAEATGWNKLADSLGFIVIYPEQRIMNNVSKCFNFFINIKAKKDKGETASIINMISYTTNKFNIDTSKVFITGMSAGAAMSNALLNAYPHIFNSGALLGAPALLVDDLNESSDFVPRVAILHGDEDKVTVPSMGEKVLNQWIKKNKLDTSSFIKTENYMNNNFLRAKSYYNSKKELKIIMLNIAEVGHKILIEPGIGLKQGGKPGIHTKEIGFHSTYWIADFFKLTK